MSYIMYACMIHANVHRHMHRLHTTYAFVDTYINTYTHACIYIYIQRYPCIYAYMHTIIHTCTLYMQYIFHYPIELVTVIVIVVINCFSS